MLIDLPTNNVPIDWENPIFNIDDMEKCHEWRRYVDSEVYDMWHLFSDEVKQALAQNFQGIADNEEWD